MTSITGPTPTANAGLRRVQEYISAIADPAAWDAESLQAGRSTWEISLTEREVTTLEAIVGDAVSRLGDWDGSAPIEAWRDAVEPLAPLFRRCQESLEHGAGIALVRNLPVRRPQTEVRFNENLIWALGAALGRPVNQNGGGQLLAHVRDLGDPRGSRDIRPEDTNIPLTHHTDGSDIILLMCVRQAIEGGNSFIASSVRTVQEIARRYPEVLPSLFEDYFAFDRYEEQPEGDDPFYLTHLCTIVADRISVRYSREMIETAQGAAGVPALTDRQRRLMDAFDVVTAEGSVEVDLRSGDLMIMNNYTVLHARSTFTDPDEPDLRRLLLRLWTAMWTARPLPFDFDRGVNTDGTGRGSVPLKPGSGGGKVAAGPSISVTA
jgi:hypothetical protein